MRTIATQRLRLVPVTTDNADTLWDVLQQPDLREFQDLPEADVQQFRRMVAARPNALKSGAWGRFEWLIYVHGADNAMGWVSLRIGERSAGGAEIGYSIMREFRGQGYATEAVRALIDEAFARVNLRRLRAYCVPRNVASRNVLERAGFEPDGIMPHGATVQGHPVDVLGFVLERTRWEARDPV